MYGFEQRINTIKRQIMLVSWDLPLIENKEIKQMKEMELRQLTQELAVLKREQMIHSRKKVEAY